MIITDKTKYKEYEAQERIATDETAQAITQAAQRVYGYYSELTIDEFWGLLSGNFELLGDMTEPSVLQVYWQRGFAEFCKTLTATLERLQVQDDPNEVQQIERGCVTMSAQESMLIFTRAYFGLHSFYDAGKIHLGEYICARKDDYNKTMCKRNYEALSLAKIRKKK